MRIVFGIGLLCVLYTAVTAAPAVQDNTAVQSDEVEQELVRHHHATENNDENDADDNTYSEEKGNIRDESSPVESIEDIPDDSEAEAGVVESYDEEDLYDITVGDVIRDVLMTLHDHPEIVKELMESEKEKLATRLADDARDDVGGDLSDFQIPAEQLRTEPKRVVKKDGKSRNSQIAAARSNDNTVDGADAELAGFMTNKRTNEVLDETFSPKRSDSSESMDNYNRLSSIVQANKPKQNKYKLLYGSNSDDSDSDSSGYNYRRHFTSSSESDDSSAEKIQNRFGYPLVNPFTYYKNYRGSKSSDSSSSSSSSSSEEERQQTGSDASKSESNKMADSSSSESSEDQLSWLLRQMNSNKRNEQSPENM